MQSWATVLADGTRDILGIWIETNECAEFWMKVYNDFKTRGVEDVLIAVTDGLKAMPEALSAVFPETTVHTCIVHLIRPLQSRLCNLGQASGADECSQADLSSNRRRGRRRGPVVV